MISRSSTPSAGSAESESETPRNIIFFRASSHKVGVVAYWSNYCKTMRKKKKIAAEICIFWPKEACGVTWLTNLR